MTEAYLNRRNTFRAFLIDECVTGNPNDRVQAKEFHSAYHMYCIMQGYNGNDIVKEQTFYEMVSNKFMKVMSDGKSYYKGVKLKDK